MNRSVFFMLAVMALLLVVASCTSESTEVFDEVDSWAAESDIDYGKHHNRKPKHVSVDFLMLSTFWLTGSCPPEDRRAGICHLPTGDMFPKDVTIHGLWPQSYHGRPLSCRKATFDDAALERLQPGIGHKWLATRSHTQEWLISHEYLKHGTCMIQKRPDGTMKTEFSTYEYLTTVLRLFDQLHVRARLEDQGIIPKDDGTTYTFNRFRAALKRAYGVIANPSCKRQHDGRNVIQFFNFCYDLSLKPIDCDPKLNAQAERQCKGDLWFPELVEPGKK